MINAETVQITSFASGEQPSSFEIGLRKQSETNLRCPEE